MAKTSTDPVTVENKPRCFVIMPISDPPDYPIGHFTRVYTELIKPAVEDAGFDCKRVDDDIETKVIILNILKMVTAYDMAICDMSSLNPNVMYELGIRQMARKPVTLIKDERTRRIFDTSILSDVEYDSSLRIDLARSAKDRIAASLRKTYEQRDTEANSLLELLNLQLQISQEKVNVSLPEKLILDRLESLAAQVDRLQNPGSKPMRSGVFRSVGSSNPPRDLNGTVIAKGDTLLYNGLNEYCLVLDIAIAHSAVSTTYLLTVQDLDTQKEVTHTFYELPLPFLVADIETFNKFPPKKPYDLTKLNLP